MELWSRGPVAWDGRRFTSRTSSVAGGSGGGGVFFTRHDHSATSSYSPVMITVGAGREEDVGGSRLLQGQVVVDWPLLWRPFMNNPSGTMTTGLVLVGEFPSANGFADKCWLTKKTEATKAAPAVSNVAKTKLLCASNVQSRRQSWLASQWTLQSR